MSFSPAVMKDGQISMKVVSYINVGGGVPISWCPQLRRSREQFQVLPAWQVNAALLEEMPENIISHSEFVVVYFFLSSRTVSNSLLCCSAIVFCSLPVFLPFFQLFHLSVPCLHDLPSTKALGGITPPGLSLGFSLIHDPIRQRSVLLPNMKYLPCTRTCLFTG